MSFVIDLADSCSINLLANVILGDVKANKCVQDVTLAISVQDIAAAVANPCCRVMANRLSGKPLWRHSYFPSGVLDRVNMVDMLSLSHLIVDGTRQSACHTARQINASPFTAKYMVFR